MKILKVKPSDPEYLSLKSMWHDAFGDEPSYIDSVYDALDAEGYVGFASLEEATEGSEEIVTSLTIYELGAFNGQDVTAIYAVCTDAQARGRGHASELVKAAVADIEADGGIAITSPAEDYLVEFYESLGFENRLYVDEQRIDLEDEDKFTVDDFDEEEGAFMPSLQMEVEQITPWCYGAWREEFLSNYPHIKLNTQMLEFVESESHGGDGMLLINSGDAICVVADSDSDELRLMELLINPRLEQLSSEIVESVAIGLAELFETKSVIYRTKSGAKIQSLSSGNAALEGAYFGFPID